MEIDFELTEKSAKNTQRWWKLTATIGLIFFHENINHLYTNKVTLKVINQDRMFFADFSVNCQPIFMKFCKNHISTES